MPTKTFQTIRSIASFFANIIFTFFEKLFLGYFKKKEPHSPPIFIIGAPRTGSTILYQYLTYYFDFYYPSNFLAYLYKYPITATIFYKIFFHNKRHTSFDSTFGQTKGKVSPHEFGEFFYRWIPGEKYYVEADDLSRKAKDELKASIVGMQRIMKKPLIMKNLPAGQRLRLIKELFPNALFIFCKRDVVSTAESLLEGRRKLYNDPQKWWSIKPKEYEKIKDLDYPEQIVKQIFYIERQIYNDLKIFNNRQSTLVQYEDFCSNTKEVLDRLQMFFYANGMKIKKNHVSLQKLQCQKSQGESVFQPYISVFNWKTYFF